MHGRQHGSLIREFRKYPPLHSKPSRSRTSLNLKTAESEASPDSIQLQPMSRRRFLTTGLCGGAGLALYSGEVERHWIEVKPLEIHLQSLPAVFDGMRIAQLSDI